MAADAQGMEVAVWRSEGGDGAGGAFQRFEVPRREHQTVLDVVTWIQSYGDPTLAYRFACRVGMCGSCAMTVNGVPRWTCRTHVQKVLDGDRLEIAPLRSMPVIRDLVVDMAGFFDKWVAAEGVFRPTRTRADAIEPVSPEDPARRAADAGIECINCGICYAACDVVADNPDYLGPAALNRAWTLVNDGRDGAGRARLEAVARGSGCHNCHSMGSCTAHCPAGLDPMASIAGLKRRTARAIPWWRR